MCLKGSEVSGEQERANSLPCLPSPDVCLLGHAFGWSFCPQQIINPQLQEPAPFYQQLRSFAPIRKLSHGCV